jgi:hypothetical protein
MRMTKIWQVASCMILIAALAQSAPAQSGYTPKEGMVPDPATAVAVARAVLIPIYGRATIAGEEPLTAQLEGDTWEVEGRLPAGHNVGGVATVKISKSDGRIVYLWHGK